MASFSSSSAEGGKIPVAISSVGEQLMVACPAALHSNNSCCYAINLFMMSPTSEAERVVVSAAQREPVQALRFSPGTGTGEPLLLCSASQTSTLLWEVDAIWADGRCLFCTLFFTASCIHCAAGEVYSPRECQSATSTAPARDVAFSEDSLHVAVCRGPVALVYDTQVLTPASQLAS